MKLDPLMVMFLVSQAVAYSLACVGAVTIYRNFKEKRRVKKWK